MADTLSVVENPVSASQVLAYDVVPDRLNGLTVILASLISALSGGSVGSQPATLRVFSRSNPSKVVYQIKLDEPTSTPMIVSSISANLEGMSIRAFLCHYLPEEEAEQLLASLAEDT
jgi:hypothetical protein